MTAVALISSMGISAAPVTVENRVESLVPSQIILEQEVELSEDFKPEKIRVESTLSVEKEVREYFKDIPALVEVSKCESTWKHFDKHGNIVRGKVNRSDIGVMQINEYYHGKTAEKLGIDLYTLEGNMAYARYLFEKEGLQPWISSSPCWNK